ncbi:MULTISPECIES: hypothetical protein [unclassified Microbacterium]|uniref:hypothetical protein n=1 Tax=Microbacterium TaxID=33882 RepID=UPI003B9E8929
MFVQSNRARLAVLVSLVDSGALQVEVTRRIPLTELPTLRAEGGAGRIAGKVVVLARGSVRLVLVPGEPALARGMLATAGSHGTLAADRVESACGLETTRHVTHTPWLLRPRIRLERLPPGRLNERDRRTGY